MEKNYKSLAVFLILAELILGLLLSYVYAQNNINKNYLKVVEASFVFPDFNN